MLSCCIDPYTHKKKLKIVSPHVQVQSKVKTHTTEDNYTFNCDEEVVIDKYQFKMLKDIPNEILVEREKECQNCVRAHFSACMRKLKVSGEFPMCNRRQMLLFGYCKDFESVDVLEVEAAANGVE